MRLCRRRRTSNPERQVHRKHRRRSGHHLASIALAPAIALGACSSGGSSPSTTLSPADAVRSVISHAMTDLAASNYAALCTYLVPSNQTCTTAAPGTFTVQNFRLGNVALQGDRALVVILADRVCVRNQPPCVGNSDPNAGLPNASLPFESAWQQAVSGAEFFTAALSRINGKWYVVDMLKRS